MTRRFQFIRLCIALGFLTGLVYGPYAHGHETHDPEYPIAAMDPVQFRNHSVIMSQDGTYRYIQSNGLPNHKTGDFPNSANPNAISEQSHKYRMPLRPRNTNRAQSKDGVIGVALNGIPIEPATAECWGQSRQSPGSRPQGSCSWREEAIVGGKGRLGLDSNNAHVQPTGAYHYHGIPWALVQSLPGNELVKIGYAADGFPIYVSKKNKETSSYSLKSGKRPSSGPSGRYDGTYTADYEYLENSGSLDECNGKIVNGQYAYFLTKSFPFAPRCLKGDADQSFERGGQRSSRGEHRSQGRNADGRRPPPRHRPY